MQEQEQGEQEQIDVTSDDLHLIRRIVRGLRRHTRRIYRRSAKRSRRIFNRLTRPLKKLALLVCRPILRYIKIESDLIVFESFFGRYISDSPLALFENLDHEKYRCFFIVNKPHKFKEYPTLKRGSLKALYYLSKAKIIVGNSRMTLNWEKKEGQVYLQTWHGTPLKRLVYDLTAYDMPIADSFEEYCEIFSQDVVRWDYLFSSCPYASEKFRSAFRFDGEILEVGYPRNHKLYHHTNENIVKIKEKLGIPTEKRVILYAPTYRDNQNDGVGNYYFHDHLDYELLNVQLEDTVILVRYHYIIKQKNVLDYENVIDVTDYQSLNDLYLISDILVTDYSSVFFDYSILKRPFFFFTPDLEEYEEDLRGFYLDMNHDFPTKPVATTADLIEQIKRVDMFDFATFFEAYNPPENIKCLTKTLELVDRLCGTEGDRG